MTKQEIYDLQREMLVRKARKSFYHYVLATMPNYIMKPFHEVICNKLQDLANPNGKIKKLLIQVPPQHGKFLVFNELCFTNKGFKKHIDLKKGDIVYDRFGNPKKVIANSGGYWTECVKITFADGESIVCAKEHEWIIECDREKYHKKGKIFKRKEELLEAQNIFKEKHRRNPCITIPRQVCGEITSLPIDPYLLGYWLGDGTSRNGNITCDNKDYYNLNQRFENTVYQEKPTTKRVKIIGLKKLLKKNNLLQNKHIPDVYFHASYEQRLWLLKGLMDSDGTVDYRGRCEFVQKNKSLARQVFILLRTLGIKPSFSEKDAKIYGRFISKVYRVFFSPDVNVFNLKRKARKLKNKSVKSRNDKYRYFIKSVEPVGLKYGNCIQVEGGTYLAGDFLIPTHNSELSSKRFPTWVLGNNPNAKITLCTYNAEFASYFNRECQNIINNDIYKELFKETSLNNKASKEITAVKNSTQFDIIGKTGFFRSVGIQGGITGRTVDILIFDDPFKNAQEAFSKTIRDRIWHEYIFSGLSRLHNNSKQLMLYTRWHEDDLAGRALLKDGEYSEENPNGWDVVRFPVIMDEEKKAYDNRESEQVLFPEKHSFERMNEIRKSTPMVFEALYQQRPSPQEGGIFKKYWFEIINERPFYKKVYCMVDSAYTEENDKDPSGFLFYAVVNNEIVILDYQEIRKTTPDLIQHIKNESAKYNHQILFKVEPKANGLPIIDAFRKTRTSINKESVTKFVFPKSCPINFRQSKEERAESISIHLEAKKVKLLQGSWNELFLNSLAKFPNDKHDEAVDCLVMAVVSTYYKKEKINIRIGNY